MVNAVFHSPVFYLARPAKNDWRGKRLQEMRVEHNVRKNGYPAVGVHVVFSDEKTILESSGTYQIETLYVLYPKEVKDTRFPDEEPRSLCFRGSRRGWKLSS